MSPNPQYGGPRITGAEDPSAKVARASEPAFIVRYAPIIRGVDTAPMPGAEIRRESFCNSLDEAEALALKLVRSGEALPDNITLYKDTNLFVALEVRAAGPEIGHTR